MNDYNKIITKMSFVKQWLSFSLLLLTRDIRYSTSLPFTVENNVVRRMEGTAVLGRGYSTTTNSFQSTCLNINGIATHSSYNYDCELSLVLHQRKLPIYINKFFSKPSWLSIGIYQWLIVTRGILSLSTNRPLYRFNQR